MNAAINSTMNINRLGCDSGCGGYPVDGSLFGNAIGLPISLASSTVGVGVDELVEVTVVVVVDVLFEVTGSAICELIVAVLVRTEPSGVVGSTVTTSMKLAVFAATNVRLVQLTVPVVPTVGVMQVQPAGADND